MSDKKELRKQIDTLMKVISNLQDDIESAAEFNDHMLDVMLTKEAFLIQFMAESVDSSPEEIDQDFEDWMEVNDYSLEEEEEEEEPEEDSQDLLSNDDKLWSIDDIMKDLNPPEEN